MSIQTEEWYRKNLKEIEVAFRSMIANDEHIHVFDLGSARGKRFSIMFAIGEKEIVDAWAELMGGIGKGKKQT